MTQTTHLGITYLQQSQAQKEVTVNEAFARIDAVLNTGAINASLATPPLSPNEGDVYIIPSSATDEWAGHSGKIAYFEQVWRFITPNIGMTLWLESQAQLYVFNGIEWVNAQSFGLRIKTGTNERMGSATLIAGTATVSNVNITASSHVFLTSEGASNGSVYISSRTVGADFIITSSDASSTNTVFWMLVEPA